MRLMDTPATVTGPINLGNPTEFTMRELTELVLVETGSSSTIISRPLPLDDPRQRKPDIALAEKRLGWVPTIPLQDGLKPTVAYFRDLSG
jgi:UDP-glucuronate decarboxylase